MMRTKPPVIIKPKPERLPRVKAVTIAVGMVCQNGVVIAADSQVSVPDYYKYHESKIHYTEGEDWALLFAYAGDPGLYQQARNEIAKRFRDSEHTPDSLRIICKEVLGELGWPPNDIGLEMVVGISCPRFETRLLIFNGKSLIFGDKIYCLGVGDSSLTRYLSELLYDSSVTTDDGVRAAICIVSKAKDYIDHCGGETVVYALNNFGKPKGVAPAEIKQIESQILGREKSGYKVIAGWRRP